MIIQEMYQKIQTFSKIISHFLFARQSRWIFVKISPSAHAEKVDVQNLSAYNGSIGASLAPSFVSGKEAIRMKQIILTGDRPTGRLHVGHYVGSLTESA